MILSENKVKDVKIAYIEIEAANCNAIIGNSIKGKDFAKSTWNYKDYCKDIDFMEVYKKFIDKYNDTGFEGSEKGQFVHFIKLSCKVIFNKIY